MDNQKQNYQTLDTIGMRCPMPVLKLRKKLAAMDVGQVIHITASDQNAAHDIPAFCTEVGHAIIKSQITDQIIEFWIRKH